MAIPITGAGSLFVKLGHELAVFLDVNAARGSAVAAPDYSVLIPTKINSNVIPDYAAGTPDYPIIQGATTARGVQGVALLPAVAAWQAQQQQFLQALQQIMIATVIDMANADVPQPNLSLQNAMALLVGQLQGNYNVAASSVAAGVQTNGVPAPNGLYPSGGTGATSGPVLVLSVKDGRGFQLDNTLAETLTLRTTRDSQSGGATLYQEPYTLTGQADASGGNMLSQLWPSGSGKSISGSYVNAALNNSGGNLLQNGEFATFTTTNQADNWTYLTGTAGTSAGNIGKSATGFLDASCLEMFGDGATLLAVTQAFNTTPNTTPGAGGTSANLLTLNDTPFAWNLWIKCSAVPSTGVLQIDLTDGAGTVINDDAGNANTATVDLTSGGINTTSWHNVHGVFHLPALDPTSTPVKLKIWQSTAVETGKNLFLDRVGFSLMQQLYGPAAGTGYPGGTGGGPFAAAFSGNLTTLVNDAWTAALTNTWGAWIQNFQRIFGMGNLGLRLPTTGGSTISTGLIV